MECNSRSRADCALAKRDAGVVNRAAGGGGYGTPRHAGTRDNGRPAGDNAGNLGCAGQAADREGVGHVGGADDEGFGGAGGLPADAKTDGAARGGLVGYVKISQTYV